MLLSVLAAATACRRQSTEYVTIALPEKFTTLDTLTSTGSDSAADRVRNLIFNTLVKKNESFEYVGELAKEIKVSPDSLVITFVLQDNVKFHNGKEFTAADVKYTFDELFKSNSFKSKAFFDTVPLDGDGAKPPANTNGGAAKPSANTNAAKEEPKTKTVRHITSIETPDPKTVVFTVTRPALKNQLLSNLV
ncbi:MAG TPA: ABC transporter substrate-binding protein, partial [Pyrinomonadaceae bacterium]|nr:ABC transporter substrate-binding protein [Pyrinomonadaceae bacterium]